MSDKSALRDAAARAWAAWHLGSDSWVDELAAVRARPLESLRELARAGSKRAADILRSAGEDQ